MLWILANKEKQAPWQVVYETLYTKYLEKRKYPFKIITEGSDISSLTEKDFLWVMHYKDLEVAAKIKKKKHCSVISQVNGSTINPYTHQLKLSIEKQQMDDIISIGLTHTAFTKQLLEESFEHTYFIETGFPVEVPKRKVVKVPKTIAITGRISPDKQFYLSVFLLRKLLPEYTIFFFLQGKDDDKHWAQWYEKEKFEKMGFHFVILPNHEEYLTKLSAFEFYFTASLSDLFGVSLQEALAYGCYPLVPAIQNEMPNWLDFVSVGYEPFSRKDLERLIREKPKFVYDKKHSNPLWCADQLIKGLTEYEKIKNFN